LRADRLISILLLLQVHRKVTAGELAKRLEVSERTILRDMDALSGVGVPVVAERGSGGGWSLLDGYQTKLTGLTVAEIQSLFLARPARLMAASRHQADFARERILVDTRGWRDPAESVACLPVLLDALWRARQVHFAYNPVLGQPGERTVDPLGLVAKGSVWYLVARPQRVEGKADEPHTYRVSRIREAVILDHAAAALAGFNLAKYWEQSAAEFRDKLPRYYAAFLASRDVMTWVRYRGWRLEQEVAEGDLVRLRLRFDSEEEATQFTLSFGGRIEVVEPPELRTKVQACAHAILERNQ
jgi:predicted DNA-binding transcriptional regulator YafY